jgi:hypothetical protein
MCEKSSNQHDGRADAYTALIKRGDAVETPDGELWVVNWVDGNALALIAAYRDAKGLVHADLGEPVETSVPVEMVTKVADARQVRRR